VPITGGGEEWETLTKDNKAADSGPVFSPDGKKLAYRAQKRAGFEADQWELFVVDVDEGGAWRGEPKSRTGKFGLSVNEFVWGAEDWIYFTADHRARTGVFGVKTDDSRTDIVDEGMNGSLSISRDGQLLAFSQASLRAPAAVRWKTPHRRLVDGGVQPNAALLAELDLPAPESATVKVEGGAMQMWILKPPGFDPDKKWPLVYLVHGGPQGAWEDGWSYRWNPELWAAQGYVVALPNPRGSTGFGQKFVDEISGDWGGKCFDDLMKGVDYL
jgi:dipeptidyl aminopeptidase/acylaminoacyl peptidase